jgi:CRISPR/Cas system CMR-associated protein Cmr1 (group 7 of RAMP superfamily)
MNQITKDYQNVHQEILELQALQKQLNHSLKTELKLIQKHFNLLRDKIVGHKSPQLK